jgi:hypothetical protein
LSAHDSTLRGYPVFRPAAAPTAPIVPTGVVVHRDGRAFADPDVAGIARDLDWQRLLGQIDVDQILADRSR